MKQPKHFLWRAEGKVGVVTLDRPERKNPLTFDSYAELRDHFRALAHEPGIKAVVLRGEGGDFSSGGGERAAGEELQETAAVFLRHGLLLSRLV